MTDLLNNLIGYIGKPIQDFHIYNRHNFNEDNTHSIIVVFVDGKWQALLVDNHTEKVIKELEYTRNEGNLYSVLYASYELSYYKEKLDEYIEKNKDGLEDEI